MWLAEGAAVGLQPAAAAARELHRPTELKAPQQGVRIAVPLEAVDLSSVTAFPAKVSFKAYPLSSYKNFFRLRGTK